MDEVILQVNSGLGVRTDDADRHYHVVVRIDEVPRLDSHRLAEDLKEISCHEVCEPLVTVEDLLFGMRGARVTNDLGAEEVEDCLNVALPKSLVAATGTLYVRFRHHTPSIAPRLESGKSPESCLAVALREKGQHPGE
jgi:hypothetical protein